MSRHERVLIDGPDGKIEVFLEPAVEPRGIALVAHPHPLFGGTADNKVVTTLARTLRELGCITLRPSFRGVGGSEGEHDHGVAETDDLLAVHAYARGRFGSTLPVYLAGFSFGAAMAARLAARRAAAGEPPAPLVLVGPAVQNFVVPDAPAHSLVVHGEHDDVVPLAAVLDWARPQALPVCVVPGAGHFFHGQLPLLKQRVVDALAAWAARDTALNAH
jgi:alpha/beta superfamily hydrolase